MALGSTTMKNRWKGMVLRGEELLCGICGLPFSLNDEITLDHIIPKAEKGVHHKRNWQPAHYMCNQTKKATIQANPNCVICKGVGYLEYIDGEHDHRWACPACLKNSLLRQIEG